MKPDLKALYPQQGHRLPRKVVFGQAFSLLEHDSSVYWTSVSLAESLQGQVGLYLTSFIVCELFVWPCS